jgi:hypothetical protein
MGPSFLLGERYHLENGRALLHGDERIPYAKQAVLTNAGINWSALASASGIPVPAAPVVRDEDILLACTAHEIYYVGRKVDYVRSVPVELRDRVTCVPDLMVIRRRTDVSSPLPGSYVAAFLRHPAGLHQVQRCIRGLRGGHVYRDDLARYVRVPIPNGRWLSEFEAVAASAEAARNRGKSHMTRAFEVVDAFVHSLVA